MPTTIARHLTSGAGGFRKGARLYAAPLLLLLLVPAAAFAGESRRALVTPPAPPESIMYVPGSTAKVCQLTGQTDKEFNVPTASQTEKRYGLIGTDEGHPFEHNGVTYFLFGDSQPTALFNGSPNAQTDSPRIADDNDAIGWVSDTSAGPDLKLNFVTDRIGAYQNPVVLDSRGNPAITLRTNETPIAGISDGGRMFAMFGTDNFRSNPVGAPPSPDGAATRSVMAVSDDSARTFHFLYNFSVAPGAKFIMTAIAHGPDGYVYFWGTMGDTIYRHSPPFLARKPAGKLADSTAIGYLSAFNPDGSPVFNGGEAGAVPLFHDSLPGPGGTMQLADCMGELGVEWNPFVRRWVMLYNSTNNSTLNPRGIYMRVAPQPWGPWSAPQTIFNPVRDDGLCFFIHRAVTPSQPACDSLSGASRLDVAGGSYGPFFISRFTSGDSVRGTSTFFYIMSTWNPYNTVIMKSSILVAGITGVSEAGGSAPVGCALEQNFPNPFNPSTVIRYRTAGTGTATLNVYDALGRLVAALVNGKKPAGSYSVTFDASGLASGVYFYRLQDGGYVRTRTMLLLR